MCRDSRRHKLKLKRIATVLEALELNVLSGDPCLPHSHDPTCFAPP